MQQLFDELGVDTTKLTHELRIFAAQLLYEMGVSLEVRGSSLFFDVFVAREIFKEVLPC
jgi:hypothetical protein